MLRFSVQETILPGLDIERKWEFAQEVGYSGIELCGGSGLKERMPELRAARKSGVSMTSVCVITDRYIGDFDADRRSDAIQTMKTLLSVVGEIGGRGAITPAAYGLHSNFLPPFVSPRSPEEDRAVLLDALGLLGDHARQEGVCVYFEPLNRYEDHMVNTLEQGVALCSELGHPAVRLMADLFHMGIEERDSASAIRDAKEWLGHVHIADSNRRQPGRGRGDFSAPLKALEDIGFDGYGAVECIVEGEPKEALRAAFSVLAKSR